MERLDGENNVMGSKSAEKGTLSYRLAALAHLLGGETEVVAASLMPCVGSLHQRLLVHKAKAVPVRLVAIPSENSRLRRLRAGRASLNSRGSELGGHLMIGFIGLGHMGGAIARRLIEGGIQLIVFDVDENVCRELERIGAVVAACAREVADRAALVMVCMPSPEISLRVARETAEGAKLKLYVEMSTIGRAAIAEIADLMTAKGVTLLDGPVSGGPRAASLGALSIMLAGPMTAVNQLSEVLDGVASKIFNVGEIPGQAQICKLVNNAIAFSAFLVSCEAIAVGVSAGIDPSLLVDVVNAGSGRNSGTTDKFPLAILPRTFNSGASLGSGIKDLDLYLSEATAAGMPAAIVASTRATWAQALRVLNPNEDFTTVVRYFESFVGAEVAGPGARVTLGIDRDHSK